jgi:hypothetical protein
MSYATYDKTIAAAATFTRTASGLACAVNKTTFVEADFVVKVAATGSSAYFKRAVAVNYVSGAHGIVGTTATTVSGLELSSDADEPGFDVQFVLVSNTLFFEAKSPAAGSFRVTIRAVEG